MNTQSGVNPFAGLARARAAAEERVERFERIASAAWELQRAVKAMASAVPKPCVEAYAKFANDVARIEESEKLLAPLRSALHHKAVAARTLHLAADPPLSFRTVTAALKKAGFSAAKRTTSRNMSCGYAESGFRCSQRSPSEVSVAYVTRRGGATNGGHIERYRHTLEAADFHCGEIGDGNNFSVRIRGVYHG